MSTSTLALATFVSVVLYKALRAGSRERGLPPGPPTSPVLGNILQVPTKDVFQRFTEWAREFGEIFSLKVGPSTIVVLSSPAALRDVLDKQSAYTSDRPPHPIADVSFIRFIESHDYQIASNIVADADRWRGLRKVAQTLLASTVVKHYLPLQEAESTQLVFDVLNSPDNFFDHIQRFSNSIVTAIIFGKRVPRLETPSAVAITEITTLWDHFLGPGATPPVDAFPFLLWIPDFLAPWMQQAKKIRKMQRALYLQFFDECQQRVDANDGEFFMANVIRDKASHGLGRDQMSLLAGSMYEAGSETSALFLQALVILLATHPEVQRKAQAELDSVVGQGRLPVYEDGEKLPYVRAIVQETHRLKTLVPMSLPHRAIRNVHYKGYLIPEGATIFGNLYAIYHDPELFENPERFNPDRYLLTEHGTKPGVDDSDFKASFVFGTGRRICPGMHLAPTTAILAAMKLLWAFEFHPAVDPTTGKEVPLDVHAHHGVSALIL
ncbi:cytochrome P450 [Schizophyllum commune H4-8]|uniref:Cytochrome P450 n=1 Tax=Schizophyllum commune (strain H4-8 / FGSC 9210) TaxID=578458 RepID=D8QBJ0_SCHCM|nr:cytochrome P450 [Schizophyllum commune H4-8]KAI5889194.1 cytochrome P450 [Schizophyllum commune H4-8]